ESRQYVTRAGNGASERNRAPPRAGRKPMADRPTIAHGRIAARFARRCRRIDAWRLVLRAARTLDHRPDAARRRLEWRTKLARSCGDIRFLPDRHNLLRAWPGPETFTQFRHRRFERTGRRRCSPASLAFFAAQSACGCANRVFARATYRRGALHPRCE